MTTYRIFPATDGPGSGDSDDSPITLGMEFYATATAWVTHLHYWRPTTSTQGTGVLGRVYAVSGTSAVSGTDVTFAPGSSTGWITAALATPIQLTANARYRVAAYVPSASHYPGTSGYWTSGAGASGITTGILVAPSNSDATGNQQGCFNYAAGLAYPGSTFGGANYWVDVTVTDVDPGASSATVTPTSAAATAAAVPTAGSLIKVFTSLAGGTATAPFSPGVSASTDLVADGPVVAQGHAYGASVGLGRLVQPSTITAWVTANGGTVVTEGDEPGPTIIALPDTADATGSAYSTHAPVVLRPATALSSARSPTSIASTVGILRRLHAGTPVELRTAHAGEPALV